LPYSISQYTPAWDFEPRWSLHKKWGPIHTSMDLDLALDFTL
jgi:hypothetical protein